MLFDSTDFTPPQFTTTLGRAFNADCFDIFPRIADGSVDMVLCDLPYGCTHNSWDTVSPLDKLWTAYKRVCKPSAAIVLTSSQPFTSILITSNLKMFKYDWTWHKPNKALGFLNAKIQPLRDKEDVCVFYAQQCTYNPQMTEGVPYKQVIRRKPNPIMRGTGRDYENINTGQRYPKQVLSIDKESRTAHPTQKPAALLEYLVSTYTNAGDVVLDNCAGSFSTGVAAEKLGRRWIGIEQDGAYFEAARARLTPVIF